MAYVQALDEEGSVDEAEAPDLGEDALREMYRLMKLSRRTDERAVALQRRGELGTYAPGIGQEAAQVEFREGEDLSAIAWGGMVPETLDAVADADADVEVIDLRSVSPMDTETVLDSVRKTGRCVVVHEAPRTGGFAAEINDDALYHLEAPVERVTGYDVPFPLFAREDAYRPDAERIRPGVERALAA